MWRRSRSKPPSVRQSSSNFSFSSFKDIENLCAADDPISDPQPSQKSPPINRNQQLGAIFHRVRRSNSFASAFLTRPNVLPPEPITESAPHEFCTKSDTASDLGAERKIILYYTSLRVVRPTFEDCRTVQTILRSFRVSIDERDLSMDSRFLDELQKIMGQIEKTKLTLPKVFIGGRYIGGAEEVGQLHETGELKKLVEGLPAAPGVCEVCGGFRFILCNECSGSHKCYTEKNGFRSCTLCNENGLIRCPSCLSR